ncbi:MAG: Cu(+)/Ag(+) sensor histidine kinase [Gammaproteobacteria bacterium]|nr:Cu(+)/Ag(+) sensor histidine kinase [Gammaproteobacteria bacterium]MBL4573484.1 Cu(+)/Ag(+) sensor histidine kinase [Gammaproteobacteria bacterium]MBL4729759.1 Cu(+)/Ag(+) sensor histidine kinase [Gammaproteobacteria bacterium]
MPDKKHTSSRPASLAARVTVFVGISTTLSLIVLGFIVQRSIEAHFLQQDVGELQVVADAVHGTYAASDSNVTNMEMQLMLENAVSGHHAIYFLVADPSGAIVYATPGADLSAIAQSPGRVEQINTETVSSWVDNGTTYRGAAMVLQQFIADTNTTRTGTLVVATSIDFHLDFMTSFYRNLWAVVIGISLFSIFTAWFAVQQGHSPLRKVSNQIRDTNSDKLHLRIDTNQVPVELFDLVSAFNDVLQRMEDVFNRLSNFSADIAHELRTPITNIMTQTQVSLGQERSVEEYQEILYSSLEEYERMAAMINDMLMLAKTESGLQKPTFVETDLRDEIGDLFEFFEAWSEESQVQLELLGECTKIHCDRSLIKRALSNLLSNAIRHAAIGSSVRVILESAPNQNRITVENSGTTIPLEQLTKLFDRFYRGDPSRQRRGDGAGLGLAIVRSIADAHGWSVTATSSDGLTQFIIEIPSEIIGENTL